MGYAVPDDQRNFGPPEGYPPSPKRRSERDDFEKYVEIRNEMLGMLADFEAKHAALRTKFEPATEAGEEEEPVL